MIHNTFPVIDLAATGSRIKELRKERGYSVRDLQQFFGFDDPRAIYKWQKGDSLPTVDNLFALARLLEVPVDDILVPVQFHIVSEQQDKSCCSVFSPACSLGRCRSPMGLYHFSPPPDGARRPWRV